MKLTGFRPNSWPRFIPSTKWLHVEELDLPPNLDFEWESYYSNLHNAGLVLSEKVGSLTWEGCSNRGFVSAKAVYSLITKQNRLGVGTKWLVCMSRWEVLN